MKKNEYVIYNRALDNMLRFTTGEVIIYGKKQEAVDDLYGDEEVVLIKDLSLRNQQIISDQLEETPILGGRMKELSTEDLRNELAERGFQTANLWHVDDVMDIYKCSDIDAMDVIRRALNHQGVMEYIRDTIDEICWQEGIKHIK